jgi:hypothetical protein
VEVDRNNARQEIARINESSQPWCDMTPTHLTSEITISVSPEIARTYQYLDETDRDRLQAQVTSFLQSITLRRKTAIDDVIFASKLSRSALVEVLK